MKSPAGRAALVLFVLFLALVEFSAAARAEDSVRYLVALADPARHLIEVTVEIPAGRAEHELQLPVWNALYQIRDFSQYVNWIRAEDAEGKHLALVQLTKSRWKLSAAERGARVHYQVFAANPGPYGAELNSRHAFLNLAEVLCYVEDKRGDRVNLELEKLPAAWRVATTLSGEGTRFWALNYDQLVDQPLEIGSFEESDFTRGCGRYRVVVDHEDGIAILKKILPSIARIVAAATDWMQDCPFENYLFIYHFPDSLGGGGMEHASSTAITLSQKSLSAKLADFESVTAHEFFHLWNVKRIRPQSLEPIDYTEENYTRALWFSEGVDSTASELILLRAGLLDEGRYLEHLSHSITELENRPAHLTQSAEESSLDAWLEKYPYYGQPGRSISYYNKGELLGVLLDLELRQATDDQASLGALFRWMNEHQAKQGRFFADSVGVQQAAEAVAHRDLAEFFERYVAGVEEIPWNRFFARVGLKLERREAEVGDAGFEAVGAFDQPPEVVAVGVGSAAEHAGLRPGDVILEVNGEPVGRNLESRLEALHPGKVLRISILRERNRVELEWVVGRRQQPVFVLEDRHPLSSEEKVRRARWLFQQAAER